MQVTDDLVRSVVQRVLAQISAPSGSSASAVKAALMASSVMLNLQLRPPLQHNAPSNEGALKTAEKHSPAFAKSASKGRMS